MKGNWEKQIKKNLEQKKVFKRKGDKLYVKWKGCDNSFNSQIDRKKLYKISQYFTKSQYRFGRNVKGELDLSNQATKNDLKTPRGIDTSNLALKLK